MTQRGRNVVTHDLAAWRARNYIDARRGVRVRVADLGAETGMNVFALSRIFRRAFGISPYAYAEQVRLEYARQELLRGEPVSLVAYRCGFADQSHLSRQFKRSHGVTPGEYARRERGNLAADGATR